jgi:hypothetical protein
VTDITTLCESITDEYWRMRVIQSLLITDAERGVSLSTAYPREFVWASGRQRDAGLLPILRGLFDASPGDLDFLSIYVWALGQLGATDELSRMGDLVSRLLQCE